MTSPEITPDEPAPAAAAPLAECPAVAETVAAQAEPPPGAADAAAPPAAPDLSPAATGARLAALFPALFVGPDGRGDWKAIKLRIHADIQARAPGQFSKRTLGIFFARYTTTTAYLKALAAPGAQRCDLDGQAAGEIAEEHRSAAAEEVARRQAIVAERRAAARKAQAPQRPLAPEPEGGDAKPARPPRERPTRPPRREPSPHAERQQPRERGRQPDAAAQGPRSAPRHEPGPALREPPATALPADPAQRERALLLRAFDASPLSKANFCALKRIGESELDALLAQARAERGKP